MSPIRRTLVPVHLPLRTPHGYVDQNATRTDRVPTGGFSGGTSRAELDTQHGPRYRRFPVGGNRSEAEGGRPETASPLISSFISDRNHLPGQKNSTRCAGDEC